MRRSVRCGCGALAAIVIDWGTALFKYLLILGLIFLVWSIASKKRTRAEAPPPVAKPAESMVCCAHCGVHLPASDSIVVDGRFYCCEAHRPAGREAG